MRIFDSEGGHTMISSGHGFRAESGGDCGLRRVANGLGRTSPGRVGRALNWGESSPFTAFTTQYDETRVSRGSEGQFARDRRVACLCNRPAFGRDRVCIVVASDVALGPFGALEAS